jgi:hypothetical protein
VNETEEQRDDRIRAVLAESVCDYAMYVAAERLGEDPWPISDAFYARLKTLDVDDLCRAVALLLWDTGTPKRMADRIVDQSQEWVTP